MRFIARGEGDAVLDERIYYSVGGGFVAGADAAGRPVPVQRDTPVPLPFSTGEELLALCAVHGAAISSVMLRNECAWRAEADVRSGLLAIWEAMQQCVRRGCETDGELPGLQVPRRAAKLYRQLAGRSGQSLRDPTEESRLRTPKRTAFFATFAGTGVRGGACCFSIRSPPRSNGPRSRR